ncbi:MAG: HipA domain-containing protein [Clostridia bacterium]
MIFELKHKNITVLEMEIDDETENILKITNVINPKHLPIGIRFERGIVDRKALNTWLLSRSIPASRENILEALETVALTNTSQLITKCFGLSLSDCYWICPKDSAMNFDEINFFTNEFSKDMGEILFGNELAEFSLMSPDNTSDGWLKKKWIIKNDNRYLVKGGSGVYKQEPFNEKIASKICDILDIPHVEYDVEYIENSPYSICENFLSVDTEFISAWNVYNHFKKPNNITAFQHLINSYEKLGIINARNSIENMLLLDFIIANTDRHMNNFGIIRDSNSLETLGVAPIFDSGTSLFMSMPVTNKIENIPCKPFKKTHDEQLQLIENIQEISDDTLEKINKCLIEILKENPFMDNKRLDFVNKQFEKRLQELENLEHSQNLDFEIKM